MRRIFHIVSPNGLGHFKRTIELWTHLIEQIECQVTIAAEKWQWVAFQSRIPTTISDNKRVKKYFINEGEGIKWHQDETSYSYAKYQRYCSALVKEVEYINADLLISDNQVAVLSEHENPLLIGSFLWSDVLSSRGSGDSLKRIIDKEEKALHGKPIPSVSIEEITMPAVKKRTDNTGIPWLVNSIVNKKNTKKTKHLNIYFSLGLSPSISFQELFVDEYIVGGHSYYAGTETLEKLQLIDVDIKPFMPFDFTDEAFSKIDLIVARPGVGIITEAIKNQIPIVALIDTNNPEMQFNTTVIEDLGIGWRHNNELNVASVLDEIELAKHCLSKRPINGHEAIKRVINEKLS